MKKKSFPLDPTQPLIGSYGQQIDLDRMGSYTGLTESPRETPVQDADDL